MKGNLIGEQFDPKVSAQISSPDKIFMVVGLAMA